MAHIVIDKNKCKSCYLCIDVCPNRLIKKSDNISALGQYTVEFDDKFNKCSGCAMCACVCPDLAIVGVYNNE